MILVLVLTAPIWLTIGGVMIGVIGGVVGGLFGAVFGIIGGILGAIFGIITIPFKIIFGGWDWNDGHWFHFSGRDVFLMFLVIVILAALKRKK